MTANLLCLPGQITTSQSQYLIYSELLTFPPNLLHQGQPHLSSSYHPSSIPIKLKKNPWCLPFPHLRLTPISNQSKPYWFPAKKYPECAQCVPSPQAIIISQPLNGLPASTLAPSSHLPPRSQVPPPPKKERFITALLKTVQWSPFLLNKEK